MNEFKATEKWYKDAAESETGIDEISAGDSLRSCPFCNGEAKLFKDGNNLGRWCVVCMKCYGRIIAQVNEKWAVRNWNFRPAPSTEEKSRGENICLKCGIRGCEKHV